MRVGIGYDIHRTGGEGPLILGGVTFPGETGLIGHSDADVLLHAVIDAILGAAGMGDIGQHFPPDDPTYAGADSSNLLAECLLLVRGKGFAVDSIDCTIIAERPKLGMHLVEIKQRLSVILATPIDRVNTKATTNEGIGAIGRGEGIAAMAVAMLTESN